MDETIYSPNPLINKILSAFNGDCPIEDLSMGLEDPEEDKKEVENYLKKISQLLESWIKENDVKDIKILCSDESSLRENTPIDPRKVSKYVDGVMPEDDWYDLVNEADQDNYWADAGDEFAWTSDCFLLGSATLTNLMVKKL